MKTIAYRDNAGGTIQGYFNKFNPTQKRHERIKEALIDLRHTGNITVFLVNGNRIRKLFRKGM